MEYLIDHFSFKKDNDYLDVEVHHVEKWIELKIDMDGSFPISSQEDLDLIYQKLSEILKLFEQTKNDK
jgi:hypothetical protein